MQSIMSHLDVNLRKHFDANTLSADEFAYQQGKEEQHNIAIQQVADEITAATLKGNYSKIDLYSIQEIQADTELFWDKEAELREAWYRGVRGSELELMVAKLMGVTNQIVSSIAYDEAPAELEQRNTDMIISMREAS